MKSNYLTSKPAPTRALTLEDLLGFDEEEHDNTASWRQKAIRLQARRWRKIKHQLV